MKKIHTKTTGYECLPLPGILLTRQKQNKLRRLMSAGKEKEAQNEVIHILEDANQQFLEAIEERKLK